MLLANVVRFNRYDFSEIRRHEPSPHGTFVYRFVSSKSAPRSADYRGYISCGSRVQLTIDVKSRGRCWRRRRCSRG